MEATTVPITKRHLERSIETGAWLSAFPSTSNDTILSPGEFRDGLNYRYNLPPVLLPSHCDGCGAIFTVEHALDCKRGGPITKRHDAVQDELRDLFSAATSPSSGSLHPSIHYDPNNTLALPPPLPPTDGTVNPTIAAPSAPAIKGDLLVAGLFKRQEECIFDVVIVNPDTKTAIQRGDIHTYLRDKEMAKKLNI